MMETNKESRTALVRVDHLKTYFPVTDGIFRSVVGYVRAVDDVSLSIFSGQTVSIVGESGCGKSTLGNSILGLVRPTAGEISLDGKRLDIDNPAAWDPYRKDFQIIFQDPNTSLNPRHTVFEIMSEPLLVHGLAQRSNVRDYVATALNKVGLSADYMARYPHAFSGGQRQRICIARAAALRPKLLVCDEVTAALDVSVQAQILELLRTLQTEMGLALLFISHDLSVVRSISDTVHVMYLGGIVESSSRVGLFERPAHPYTRALLDSIPTLRPGRRPVALPGEIPSPVNKPAGCPFHTRCPRVDERCRVEQTKESVVGESLVKCFFPLESASKANPG